jgi:hypothetical protein
VSSLAYRRLCQALGLLWVLDGALQLQPYMWGPGFFADLIGMANMGLPHAIEQVDFRLTDLLAAHPLPWDLLFAGVQIGLGIGLLSDRFRRAALASSVVWGLVVWVVGEGFGGLFMPGTSMLNGAPGPVLLYVVVAVLLWPAEWSEGRRARLVLAAWSALWWATALLELGAANHAQGVPAAEIGDGAGTSLWPVGVLQRIVGHHLEGRGLAFAVTTGILGASIGSLVWVGATRRAALLAGSTLSILWWALGQDLGGLSTGRATDPGAGPLWILLAAVVWSATPASGTNRRVGRGLDGPARGMDGDELVVVGQLAPAS